MNRYLVTGSSGFIGFHVAKILSTQELADFQIMGLYHKNPAPLEELNISGRSVDLLSSDEKTFKDIFDEFQPTHLIHCAWCTKQDDYLISPDNAAWERASKRLIDVFYKFGGKHATILGTCLEYDVYQTGSLKENKSALSQETPYARSKNSLRIYLEERANSLNRSYNWGRVFFGYGPREKRSRLVPYIINALLQGKKVSLKHGDYLRDYIFVEDIAKQIVMLARSQAKGVFNLGTGKMIPLKKFYKVATSVIGHETELELSEEVNDDGQPREIQADMKKFRAEIGDFPQTSLERGLSSTVDYWKKVSGVFKKRKG